MLKGLGFFIKQGWKYDKRYIIWNILYQFVHSFIPVVAAIMPKFMIDELFDAKRMDKLILYMSILIGYLLIGTALSVYFQKDGFTRRCKVSAEFDSNLHERLYKADFENLENPLFLDKQEKAKKFLYCDWHGFGYLLDSALCVVGQFFTLIGIAAVIVTLNAWIVLLFVILTVLGAMIEGNAKKKAIRLSEVISADQRGWMYFAKLFEDFSYGKELRLNTMGKWLLNTERDFFTRVNHNLKQQNDGFIKSGMIGALFTAIQQCAAYAYFINEALKGNITIGSFTMYIGAVTTFTATLRAIMNHLVEIRVYDMYYKNLDEYLSVPVSLRSGKQKTPLQNAHTIEFRDVSFRYAGQKHNALNHINITLSPGEKLSIVGENGAGKTTFIKLLTRLYDPTDGEIFLDGLNIKDIDYDSYMSVFSTVFQDYKLFAFSLQENVALGLPQDKAKVESALRRVGFGDRLGRLKNGVDTAVYKNFDAEGFEPSGGESQKIAMARALYKNAPVFVLDEPTAALDPRAEFEIYQHFNELVEGKTTIYISHRLSSTKFCDKIAVFDHGHIVEYGTHDELMKKKGKYAELFKMQAQFYI